MKKTLGLKEIYQILRKKLWLIVAVTALFALIGALATHYFMTPVYKASTRILVNQSGGKALYDSNELQTNVQLVNTYSELINDPSILKQVIKEEQLALSPDALQGMLTVDTNENSQIFTITVSSGNPAESVKIVNGIARVFRQDVQKTMNVNNVHLLAPATLETSRYPVSPDIRKNVIIAVALGLLLSIGFAFLLEYLDNTVKSEEDIQERAHLPVLGVIGHAHGAAYSATSTDRLPHAESLTSVRTGGKQSRGSAL